MTLWMGNRCFCFVIHKRFEQDSSLDSSIIWIRKKKYHNFRFLLSLKHINCLIHNCTFITGKLLSAKISARKTHPKNAKWSEKSKKKIFVWKFFSFSFELSLKTFLVVFTLIKLTLWIYLSDDILYSIVDVFNRVKLLFLGEKH